MRLLHRKLSVVELAQRDARIRDLRRQGVDVGALAERFDLTRGAIRRITRGIEPLSQPPLGRALRLSADTA